MEKNYIAVNARQATDYDHVAEGTSAIRSAPNLSKPKRPADTRLYNPSFLNVNKPHLDVHENSSTLHPNNEPTSQADETHSDDTLNQNQPLTKKNGSSATILPPDGGWGWVVCFASLLIVLIIDGVLFSFGVFFLDLLESFKESRAKTAWVGSTVMGVHMAVGPVVSVMVNKYGCRIVTITGALISTFGIGVSIISPNVDVLILTYGFLGGFGFSMMFIPAILMVNFYFDNKRAFANGMAMCGSGLGMFVFANLCNALTDAYDWRGSTLIIAGIVLNCAVCGSMYRPIVESYGSTRGSKESLDYKAPKKTFSERICICCKPSRRYTEEQVTTSINELHKNVDENEEEMRARSASMSNRKCKDVSLDMRPGNKPLLDPRIVSIKVTDFSQKQQGSSVNGINTPNWMLENTGANITQSFTDIRSLQRRHRKNCQQQAHTPLKLAMSPLYRKDIFYSGNILKLPEFQSRGDLRSYTKSVMRKPSLAEEDGQLSVEEMDKNLPKRIANMCRSIDLKMFMDPLYLIFTLSSVFWTAQSTVMNFIPEYVVLQGLTKENAAMLVSTVGITNVLGRLTTGWLCDRPHMDCKVINATALICGGFSMVILPFTANYAFLICLCAVFGFCMGTWVALRPICLVDLFGIEKLTNSLGILVMFQGAAFTIGPPIAGWLFDLTNSHLTTFLSCGVIFICSGLLCGSLRWLKIRRMRNELQNRKYKSVASEELIDLKQDTSASLKNGLVANGHAGYSDSTENGH
ncbi:unnamed protein product [Owenia fusiformis]|uniref:Uncharacterized protein n=1 Tax=Owenia fusiformis TaxID=6347 RepID=A0A8J1Y6M3_OWEFU|nr:unnamed protein product [Owenia fusiformis]